MPRLLVFLCCLGLIFLTVSKAPHAYGATFTAVSDTLTTSRPSAATPLTKDVAAGDYSAQVANTGATFLASDSATLWGGTTEIRTVATVSADKQTIFFTSPAAYGHTTTTMVTHAVTAMHTIKFTTQTGIPSGGSVVISFPNATAQDTNGASPSAATFMFNGLSSGNIQTNNLSCGSWTITQSAGGVSQVVCNLSSAIASGTKVTLLIGCSAASSGVCTTQNPTLINPTKSAVEGTADVWRIGISSYSSSGGSGTLLDSVVTKVGTIETPTVNAHIDPTFSLTISGVADGFDLGTVCDDHFKNPDKTNSGFASTSTDVDLGTLLFTQVNIAAQKMVVTSNAILGYTVTATSSGHLLNPINGYYIADAQGSPTADDSPSPASIVAGSNKFGIHPCDAASQGRVDAVWGATENLFANPAPSYYYTLVTSNNAPGQTGDTFYVEYAASPAGTTPPGTYRTTVTYVATTVF